TPTNTGVRPWRRSSCATCLSVSALKVPVRSLPSEAMARKWKLATASELLRDAHHFFGGCDAVAHLQPAVLAQAAHAVSPRGAGDVERVFVGHDELADFVIELHQFED